MKWLLLLFSLFLVGCATAPQLQFLKAVQPHCDIDKAEMNDKAVKVKCFQHAAEEW